MVELKRCGMFIEAAIGAAVLYLIRVYCGHLSFYVGPRVPNIQAPVTHTVTLTSLSPALASKLKLLDGQQLIT